MSYWDHLAEATGLLARSDLRAAERAFLEARRLRERSPGRVFWSEKLGDAARGLLSRVRRESAEEEKGRWERDADDFVAAFHEAARATLRAARELPASSPGAGAAPRLELLTRAAFLTAASTLSPLRDVDPSPFLCGALDAARELGVLPAAGLIPPGLPLPGAVRLRLVALGLRLLRTLPGDREPDGARALALDLAGLLGPEHFAAEADRAERLWYAAVLHDEHLDEPAPAAELYAECAGVAGVAADTRDAARLRAAELEGNVDALRLPLPRYERVEALLVQPCEADPALEARRLGILRTARDRRPRDVSGAWCTVSPAGGGGVVVLWEGRTPRDIHYWTNERDGAAVRSALAGLKNRTIGRHGTGNLMPGWKLPDLVEVLLEPVLPAAGVDGSVLDALSDACACAEALAVLPRCLEAPRAEALAAALTDGYAWLGALSRLRGGDPTWRAGVRRLARRGDAAAQLVSGFLDPDLIQPEGWPLTPLDVRPSPAPWPHAPHFAAPDRLALPDASALVAFGGDPACILRNWGGKRPRWHVALDRPDRLADLRAALAERPSWTLLPPGGLVHDRPAALAELESRAARSAGVGDLGALMHWCRLVGTHNGDLLDHRRLRPRAPGALPLWDRYAASIAGLPLRHVGEPGEWQEEFRRRAAAAAAVVGAAEDLPFAPEARPAWGLAAAEPAAWVFWESAAVHWDWWRRGADPRERHARLHTPGAAHLSLIADGRFLGEALTEACRDWLASYGEVATTTAPVAAPAVLRLAGAGVAPDARVMAGEAAVGLLLHLRRRHRDGASLRILAPVGDAIADFVTALHRGEFAADALPGTQLLETEAVHAGAAAGGVLVVPRLVSLDPGGGGPPDLESWRRRDAQVVESTRRRRLACALEVGALLSSGAAELEICDARWWRSFPLTAAGKDLLQTPPTAEALACAATGVTETFDLPVPAFADARARRGRRRADDPHADAAWHWLRVQGWIDDRGLGLPPGCGPVAGAFVPDLRGLTLALGDGRDAWRACLERLAAARESGQTTAWLLVVADAAPPEAALLRDAHVSPGRCRGVDPGSRHAVVWLRPEELADPAVAAAVTRRPPLLAWASDLRTWIPAEESDAGERADALQVLLHGWRGAVVLHASELPGSWGTFFHDRIEGAGGVVLSRRAEQVSVLDLPPTAVGRVGHPEFPCPVCGETVAWRRWDQACPDCGMELARWLPADRRAAVLSRLREDKLLALRARTAQDAGPPLCVWTSAAHVRELTHRLDRHGIPWRRQATVQIGATLRAGEWLVCVPGAPAAPPAECRHALLVPPADEDSLQQFRRRARGETSLWFHPLELDAEVGGRGGQAWRGVAGTGRWLLAGLSGQALQTGGPRLTGPVSPRVAETLLGAPSAAVRLARGVGAVSAAVDGRLERFTESSAPRRLVLNLTLVEAEYQLLRVGKSLSAVLKRLLADLRPGAVAQRDVQADAGLVDAAEADWTDRFLLGASAGYTAGESRPCGLLYLAGDGPPQRGGRLVGRVREIGEIVEALLSRRDALLELYARLAAAPPGSPAAAGELLDAGVLLGLWSVEGDAEFGEIRLGELGEGAVTAPGVVLLTALWSEARIWRDRLEEACRLGFLTDVNVRPPAARPATETAPALRLSATGPLTVLRGPAGTGRHRTAAALLDAAWRDGEPPARLVVLAPDAAAGARFHHDWRELGPGRPALDLRLAAEAAPSTSGESLRPAITLLLEAQDLPPAVRFGFARAGEGERRLWTLEPVLTEESWEHLFLDAPPRDAVHDLAVQDDQSRRVWEEMRDLAELILRRRLDTRPGRRERGGVKTCLTDNRDDAVALLTEQQQQYGGWLWNLAAPVAGDLAYLGRAAAREGWLPVLRGELDALLLPGPLEFLAVVSDLLERRAVDPDHLDAVVGDAEALLPVEDAADYRRWLRESAPDATCRVDDLLQRVERSGWAVSFLGGEAARRRVDALVAGSAALTLAELMERPLLEAWRQVVGRLPGLTPAAAGPPILALTTHERQPGPPAAPLACLCVGNESPRRLYRAMSRAGDRLVVFYKDRSPFASAGDD